jgi:hypothetical protein
LLVGPACSDESGVSRATRIEKPPEIDEGNAFVQPGPDFSKLGPPINLLEQGKPTLTLPEGDAVDPAMSFAYGYERGYSQPFDFTLEGSLEPSMGPTTLPKQKQPSTRIRGVVNVDARTDTGASLRFEIIEVKIRGPEGDPFGLGRTAENLLRSSRLRVALDRRGLVRMSTLELPQEIDPALHPHLPAVVSLAAGLGRVVVPVPLSPKKGARWTVTDRYVDAGALVTQHTEYEMLGSSAADGDLEFRISTRFEGSWWAKRPHASFGLGEYEPVGDESSKPLDPVEPVSFELEGEGEGRIVVSLGQVLPHAGTSTATRRTRSVVEEKGATQRSGLVQELRLQYGALGVEK